MATNATTEPSNAAHQGVLSDGGRFTKSGKLIIIGVVALLVVVAVGCSESNGAGDGGSGGASGSSQSEWVDDCINVGLSRITNRRPSDDEREETEEECQCNYDFIEETTDPPYPLLSSIPLEMLYMPRFASGDEEQRQFAIVFQDASDPLVCGNPLMR